MSPQRTLRPVSPIPAAARKQCGHKSGVPPENLTTDRFVALGLQFSGLKRSGSTSSDRGLYADDFAAPKVAGWACRPRATRRQTFFGHQSDTETPEAVMASGVLDNDLIRRRYLVAGIGFEPMTFRL